MAFPADKFIGDAVLTKTHIADEALVAMRFVKLVTATGQQPHCVYADSGELATGVCRDAYAIGKLADVVLIGTAWVTTSENVAAQQLVSPDADGKAQVAAGGEYIAGIAQTDANSDEPVLVLLGIGGVV